MKKLFQRIAHKMRTNPYLTLLLLIQILIMIWNAVVYPSQEQYDMSRHFTSVANGGLIVSIRNFDPPLYYMATLPFLAVGKLFDIQILQNLDFLIPVIKVYNIFIISAFNILWLYWIIPRLLPDKTTQNIAGTLLLALPGYEKLAAMVHADNLLTLLATVVFVLWLYHKLSARSWSGIIYYALLLALIALTRPFAVVPVAIFAAIWFQMVTQIAKQEQQNFSWIAQRVFVFCAIVAIPISSWWAIRYLKTDQFVNIADSGYYEKYNSRRDQVDLDYYIKYSTSFYFKQLLTIPNRNYDALMDGASDWRTSLNNSFWTVAYSDFWGDHWLFFSGPQSVEGKLWPKRILFIYALPITVLLVTGFTWNAIRELGRAARNKWKITPLSVAAMLFVAGFGLWILWQTFIALEPGKNSGIKFIYNAYYVPFAIPVALAAISQSPKIRNIGLVLSFLLYILALPISIYWR